jgi:hypothetical protein
MDCPVKPDNGTGRGSLGGECCGGAFQRQYARSGALEMAARIV